MTASLPLVTLLLSAAAVANTSYEPAEGSFVLRHEAVVPAPPTAVWEAFSTAGGWMEWAVPFACIDLRLGGRIETSYDPHARPGDPANIQSRILAFLPGRMLAFQAMQAPPDFPHAELLADLFSVVEITPHSDGQSRVAISGVGYTDSPGHLELRAFFDQGNAWTLERLVERFTRGPVDWSVLTPPAPEAASDSAENLD
ncbi:MAG TPA: SRPBCC domain-containing protein [Gammaproteobacteria bacterium]|nr:SRPBCC domain-containing protein [Gammaproteobacteria bacterium]